MSKPISRPVHGFIDYNYVAAVAPAFLAFGVFGLIAASQSRPDEMPEAQTKEAL